MHRVNWAANAAAFALLVLLSMPAAAQYGSAPPPPPPEPPRRGAPAAPAATTTPTPAAPAEVLRAAACAVGRDANSGNALLATLPRSPEERTAAAAFLRLAERCLALTSRLNTTALILRGAVAESLYEAQFANPATPRSPALGAAPLARPTTQDEMATALAPMYALVDCALPRRPELARVLLTTEPRSPEESAAFQALGPAFGPCVPSGSPVNIDPRAVRSMFAESLYRWSVVQRDGPASPWAAPATSAPAPAPGG
ncbi:MAG TPA: hypothetical protein VEW71_07180 [Allosphingosinicella sp.]|nr:hypothetical protein [Allosphingosinicella sp.]